MKSNNTAWPDKWRIFVVRRERDDKFLFSMTRNVARELAKYERRGVEVWLVTESSPFRLKHQCRRLLTEVRRCRTTAERLALIEQNTHFGRLLGITCPASKPIIR